MTARREKKVCERCSVKPAVRRERYCTNCKQGVLGEIEASGRLEPKVPRDSRPRFDSAYTEEGEDSPWHENAVGDMEDGES